MFPCRNPAARDRWDDVLRGEQHDSERGRRRPRRAGDQLEERLHGLPLGRGEDEGRLHRGSTVVQIGGHRQVSKQGLYPT